LRTRELERKRPQRAQDPGCASVSFLRQFFDAGTVDRNETELSGDEETIGKDQRCYREQA
jgi:hypothetical protein